MTENGKKVGGGNEEKKVVPKRLDDYGFPMLKHVIATPKTKNELEEVLLSMTNTRLFEVMGVKPEKVFLFTGEPGLGKTFGARAIRNEFNRRVKNPVMWFQYDTGVYGTAYINMGAVTLTSFFNAGNQKASEGAHIIYFFDEADVLLSGRGNRHHKEDDKVTEAWMKCVNDLNQHGERQYVFLATNFEKNMDSAVKRSGRIDRIVNFEKPGVEELIKAYSLYENLSMDRVGYKLFRTPDNERLAEMSIGFSYADVQSVVERSVRSRLYELLRDKNDCVATPFITQKRLEDGVTDLKNMRKDKGRKIGFLR